MFGEDHNTWNSAGIFPFTGGPCGLKIQEAPYINKDSTPITILLFFFMEVIQLMVAETNNTTINI
jgi:hypothetical protein